MSTRKTTNSTKYREIPESLIIVFALVVVVCSSAALAIGRQRQRAALPRATATTVSVASPPLPTTEAVTTNPSTVATFIAHSLPATIEACPERGRTGVTTNPPTGTTVVALPALTTTEVVTTNPFIVATFASPPLTAEPNQRIATPSPTPALWVWPYLGEVTRTTAVISWATHGAQVGQVRYSLDSSYNNVVTATCGAQDGEHWHSATLTGLTPGSTYHYRVYNAADDVTPWPDATFTTAPEVTAPGFTFVVLGDSRSADGSGSGPSHAALELAAALAKQHFDLALHTGDLVSSGGICAGDDSAWRQYVRQYFDLYRDSLGRVPFYPSLGNHELNSGDCGYRVYTALYHLPENAPAGDVEEYYSFDWGNAHFVALDTNQGYSPASAQYAWLVHDLQASTQLWKFAFFHHPAYSSGYHSGTNEVHDWLTPVFEAYGVDVVFSGHDHHYERTCPLRKDACTTTQAGGVVYYVTGGAGAPAYSASGDWFTAYYASRYHFLRVEVNGRRLRVDALDVDGLAFDSYEIEK